jgi:hypothetical protein
MVADMKMLLAQIPGRQALYLDNTVSRAVAIESWNQLHLDINRAVDEKGRPIGLTERPGTPPLREQYQRLKVQLGGSKVVLIDDVIGPAASTIIEVMNDLEREGIYVEEIRAPYGFNTGVKVLIDQDVRVICPNMFGSSSDICCLRDTIPFLPTGGLKMRGLTLQGDAEEWRSVPYIYTYLHKPLWGKVFTIPDRFKQRHMLFSSLVAMTLFLSLEDLNHRKITYKDLGYVTDQTINLDDSSVVTEVEKWMFRVLTEDYEGVS